MEKPTFISSSFSSSVIWGGLAAAAVPAGIAFISVKWAKHTIAMLQSLKETSLGPVVTIPAAVVLVSSVVDSQTRAFLTKTLNIKKTAYLHMWGTGAGLSVSITSAALAMKYSILPISLYAGTPLIGMGVVSFLVYKAFVLRPNPYQSVNDQIPKMIENSQKLLNILAQLVKKLSDTAPVTPDQELTLNLVSESHALSGQQLQDLTNLPMLPLQFPVTPNEEPTRDTISDNPPPLPPRDDEEAKDTKSKPPIQGVKPPFVNTEELAQAVKNLASTPYEENLLT